MMFKRILAVIIVAAMAVIFSSCGKNDSVQVSQTAAVTDDGKKIVKVYVNYNLDDELYGNIADFNRKNWEYEVQITDYKNFDEPLTRLNTDITMGNSPDILILGNGQPIKSYIDKNMFADLYEFIDSDSDIKREDFIDNFLRANETDGKLFKISFDFYIETVAGKTSLVGEKQGRSAEEFFELAESYPDKRAMSADMTKYSALQMFASYGYSKYIDESTGKCSFDSGEFVRLLEFCNQLPNEFEGYSPEFSNELEYALFNGTTLFSSEHYIHNFSRIRYLEYGVFGEPVTLIGFPNVGGNGSVIIPTKSEYAIMSDSPNKEGAWEFLKYFLTEEYQDKVSIDQQSFPIRKTSLALAAEEAKKGVYYSDTGKYDEPKTLLMGSIVGVGVNTDEDNKRIYDLINSATGVSRFDVYIYDIIKEEAGAYFAGQKSADEVAEIIQNRVQNYIDENR